jgi:hypothetical protein
MGAQFQYAELLAKTDTEALVLAEVLIDQAEYAFGKCFNGNFGECSGVTLLTMRIAAAEVKDFLEVQCEKFGPMLIIQATDGTYHAGALCAS